MRIRIKRSPFSDVKAGEFAELIERRHVGQSHRPGDLFYEAWIVRVLPRGKLPAREHVFKVRELELVR